MKGEELFRAVGQVGDDLIARAEKTPARQASRWRPLAALAACCVLLVGIAALVLPGWLGSSKSADTAAPAAAAEENARAYSEDILVESAAPEAEFEEYAAAQEAPAMEAPPADAPAEDTVAEEARGGEPGDDEVVAAERVAERRRGGRRVEEEAERGGGVQLAAERRGEVVRRELVARHGSVPVGRHVLLVWTTP